MIEIIGVLSLLGFRNLSGALYGLIRSKLLAYFTGPLGLGIFSQARTFLQLLDQISTVGSKSGLLKIIAEQKEEKDSNSLASNSLASTIAVLLLFFGTIATLVSILGVLFSVTLSIWIFHSAEYSWVIQVIATCAVFYVEFYLILTTFQAISRWKYFVRVAVAGDILSTIIMSLAIAGWGLAGAITGLFICYIFIFTVAFISLNSALKSESFGGFRKARLSLDPLRQLSRFIGPLTLRAIVEYASLLVLRSEIIRQLGINANGLFQVIYGTSILYMDIFTQMLFSYGIPKLTTHLHDPGQVIKIQNNLVKLGILILSPLTILLLLTRQIWIPLLYDSAFLTASSVLVWQFGGDLLRIMRTSINSSLLPQERFWVINLNEITYWLSWIIFMNILMPYVGILAAGIGYFLANLSQLPLNWFYHHRHLGFRMSPENKLLILKALPITVAGFTFANKANPDLQSIILTLTIFMASLILLPSRKDYRQVFSLIHQLGKRQS